MKTCSELPIGYSKSFEVDLQKNKKLAVIINLIAFVIAVIMIATANIFVPINLKYNTGTLVGMLVMLFGMVLYIILHEIVHGIFMKKYSGIKPSYGFTFLYAYAGSTAYFNKKNYITIALAPVVIWGVVLLVLNIIVPTSWFYVVYIIQVANISGAVGDIYVTCKFHKLSDDILINDTGVAMTVWEPISKKEDSI